MKLKVIGLATLLLLSSCVDLTPEGSHEGPIYPKTFGTLETKAATVPFEWENGDQVCVYSIGEDGIVLYKDTCAITNAHKSKAKLTAMVHEDAVEFYSCYPYNAMVAEIGEPLNKGYHLTCGKLKEASIMEATIPSNETLLYYTPNCPLVAVGSTTIFGLESFVDIKLHFYIKEIDDVEVIAPANFRFSDNNPYYIPISTQTVTCTKFTATVNVFGARVITKYPTKQLEPGVIYPYQFCFIF